MVEYYKDNPNVEVIIDRRTGPDRRNRKGAGDDGAREQRTIRDRRRPRVPGTFPDTDAPATNLHPPSWHCLGRRGFRTTSAAGGVTPRSATRFRGPAPPPAAPSGPFPR